MTFNQIVIPQSLQESIQAKVEEELGGEQMTLQAYFEKMSKNATGNVSAIGFDMRLKQ